tara:strand:+ start:1709 stop:1999 length:291 start_codon:yes stop_codon:yes gene_type:complete
MKREKWSGYDKYVVLADQCKYLSGGYEGFVNLREIMETLTLMCSKQQNTYTYNGEVYVSNLTSGEINRIQDGLDTGKYDGSFNMVRLIKAQLGIKI